MKKSSVWMLALAFIGASPFILIGAVAEAEEGKFAEITMKDIEEISKVQYLVKS